MNNQSDRNISAILRESVPLAPFTTIGIGGPARYFAEVTTVDQLKDGIDWARSRQFKLFILGGGSNIVVADNGFDGLVVQLSIAGVETNADDETVSLVAGAGEDWESLVSLCVSNGWAGFECLSGIPGRVGATPIQNVGAYGQETSETLIWVEALDLAAGAIVTIPKADCQFGYRDSRFKKRDRNRFIVTRVAYRLIRDGKPSIRYMDLQVRLAGAGIKSPSLSDVREAVLGIRRNKAMVIDPADPNSKSVGSFFVNPVISKDQLEQVKQKAAKRLRPGQEIPTFNAPDGRVKLAAAFLIEHAGFEKGYTFGNVGISRKHSLAIINRGGGTAREVLDLASRIKARVRDAFGVSLTPEPVFVGFD